MKARQRATRQTILGQSPRKASPKAQRLNEKNQDRLPGLKFSSEIEKFKRGTHQTPIFYGEFRRSRFRKMGCPYKKKNDTSNPPPFQNPPPPKTRNFMCVGVFQQKEPKNARRPQNRCCHFRPQKCGRKNYQHQAFSERLNISSEVEIFKRD